MRTTRKKITRMANNLKRRRPERSSLPAAGKDTARDEP
jgi:hypothetical protein